MKKRVTLADVAKRAGLSKTAVSLILNGRTGTRLSQRPSSGRDAQPRNSTTGPTRPLEACAWVSREPWDSSLMM